MLMATFWFALMNVFVKKLAHLPTMELVFFRCSVASVLGYAGLKRLNVPWLGSNRKLLLLRGFFGTMGLYTFFYTMQRMPLGTAVTIQYLSPVFTSIIAMIFLKEYVRPVQWFCFLISFLGVILIKGFDTRISWDLLLVGVVSAFFSALAYNMIRTIKEKEHPLVVVLHFQLFGAVTGLIFSVLYWETPKGLDWLYILLLGIFTQLAQVNMTRAIQAENVAKVTILNYFGVVFAIGFGWLLFGETYDFTAIGGMLLVIGGVILNILIPIRKLPDAEEQEIANH
jgi:drug/metabolite transporter (DMT)-like permease